jgi:hypothetical protein
MTPKQEEALREYLQEAIVPMIEQVLVKKLGQAMTFAKQEVIAPPRQPLTDDELYKVFPAIASYTEANKGLYRSIARAIEAAHGITGESK